MTEKQQALLQSAQTLIAAHGLTAMSTAKIAAHAGVSEALIFRHFKSKNGLIILRRLLYFVLIDMDDKPDKPLPLNNRIKKFSI